MPLATSALVPLGEPFTLLCGVVLTQSAIIVNGFEWYHNSVLTAEISPSLRFANFQGRSGGKYTCRAKTSETCVKESGIFTLYTTPDVVVHYPSAIMIDVGEGEDFRLQCETTGWPKPTIQWLKKNVGVVSYAGMYNVTSASLLDGGTYICKAVNVNGESRQTRVVRITSVSTRSGDKDNETSTKFSQTSFNGTNPLWFSVGMGLAAVMGVSLTSLTLLCCIISLYINCCRSLPAKEHNPYEDWPDNDEGKYSNQGEMAQVGSQKPSQYQTVEILPRINESVEEEVEEEEVGPPSPMREGDTETEVGELI